MFHHILSKDDKESYSIKQEIKNIEANIERSHKRMSEIAALWGKAGAPCCPACWSEEYRILAEKEDRRYERINYLKSKFEKDSRIKQND